MSSTFSPQKRFSLLFNKYIADFFLGKDRKLRVIITPGELEKKEIHVNQQFQIIKLSHLTIIL